MPQAPPKLEPGKSIKPITVTNLDGKRETISYADAGNATVFYVFSPTCIWCERNAQNIDAIARLKGNSFRFIGLSVSDDKLSEWVESHHFSFPDYKDLAPESVQTLGLASTPQTIAVSPDGRVLKNWVGAYTASVQPQVEDSFNVRLPGLVALKS